jgi:hypothetical protein
MAQITRSYSAVAGATYREALPKGYRSATFSNNSGHYIWVRTGGMDAPADAGSAEYIVPPYTMRGIGLRGNMLAMRFADTSSQIASSLATGVDGVCDAEYSDMAITPFAVQLPGAVGAIVPTPPPSGGGWSRTSSVASISTPTAMKLGPALIRAARVGFQKHPVLDGQISIYTALQIDPTTPLEYLAVGETLAFATSANIIPPIAWEAGPGAEIQISIAQGLYASPSVAIGNVFMYVEYR